MSAIAASSQYQESQPPNEGKREDVDQVHQRCGYWEVEYRSSLVPEKYVAQKLDVAMCEYTGPQFAQSLSEVSDANCKFAVPVSRMSWFESDGWCEDTDIDAFRKVEPDYHHAKDWCLVHICCLDICHRIVVSTNHLHSHPAWSTLSVQSSGQISRHPRVHHQIVTPPFLREPNRCQRNPDSKMGYLCWDFMGISPFLPSDTFDICWHIFKNIRGAIVFFKTVINSVRFVF
mmetsp:Transcript_18914/g.27639  ORF Transcript_18914/g.27639 Transcript_18914/m.27639 type:complete len:231 (-) Transcript_18914:98-790(-)